MLKRLLISLLSLSILSSGMAYAWDADAAVYLGHGVVDAGETTGDDTTPEGDKAHTEDHCCHGDAHLVVLLEGLDEGPLSIGLQTHATLPPSSLRHLYIAPLLRPPIA